MSNFVEPLIHDDDDDDEHNDHILTPEEQNQIDILYAFNQGQLNSKKLEAENDLKVTEDKLKETQDKLKVMEDNLKEAENNMSDAVTEVRTFKEKIVWLSSSVSSSYSSDSSEEDDMMKNEHKMRVLEDKLKEYEYKLLEAEIEKNIAIHKVNIQKSTYEAKFSILKCLGFNPNVTVNNISGKKSWIFLSPAPIVSVSSVGLDKVGQVSFASSGDYKCQQSSLSNNSSRDFELDNSQIYYTVFFDCDGKWKTPFKNRKINTKKYNINLLERHVNDAVDADFLPVN